MKKMTKFEELGLEKKLLDTLDEAGFTTPFPIQERTIPVLLEGSDVIGQAHTGTGKTAAYALPILQKITAKQGIQGIVMAPTRELALQITTEINRYAKYYWNQNYHNLWRSRYGNTTRCAKKKTRDHSCYSW